MVCTYLIDFVRSVAALDVPVTDDSLVDASEVVTAPIEIVAGAIYRVSAVDLAGPVGAVHQVEVVVGRVVELVDAAPPGRREEGASRRVVARAGTCKYNQINLERVGVQAGSPFLCIPMQYCSLPILSQRVRFLHALHCSGRVDGESSSSNLQSLSNLK